MYNQLVNMSSRVTAIGSMLQLFRQIGAIVAHCSDNTTMRIEIMTVCTSIMEINTHCKIHPSADVVDTSAQTSASHIKLSARNDHFRTMQLTAKAISDTEANTLGHEIDAIINNSGQHLISEVLR